MAGRGRRGNWTPSQIELDELDSFCFAHALKELNALDALTDRLFPDALDTAAVAAQHPNGVEGLDLDERVPLFRRGERELREAALCMAARIVVDRVVTVRTAPKRKSLKNLFMPKKAEKVLIFDRDELKKDVGDIITTFMANDLDAFKTEIDKRRALQLQRPLTDASSYRGLKPTNEDRVMCIPDVSVLFGPSDAPQYQNISYYAVYDGHGGETCAEYLKSHLHFSILRHENFFTDVPVALKAGFMATNANFKRALTRESQNSNAGSTSTVAIVKDNTLYLAWAGDSPAFLISDTGDARVLLDPPHSSSNESERKRVEALGGVFLKDNDNYRLNGSVTVTRSFGDFRITCMTAEPDIVKVPITATDRYLVLSSDGLTDVMTPKEVGEYLRGREGSVAGEDGATTDVSTAAPALASEAEPVEKAAKGAALVSESTAADEATGAVTSADVDSSHTDEVVLVPGKVDESVGSVEDGGLVTAASDVDRTLTTTMLNVPGRKVGGGPLPVGAVNTLTQEAVDLRNSMDNIEPMALSDAWTADQLRNAYAAPSHRPPAPGPPSPQPSGDHSSTTRFTTPVKVRLGHGRASLPSRAASSSGAWGDASDAISELASVEGRNLLGCETAALFPAPFIPSTATTAPLRRRQIEKDDRPMCMPVPLLAAAGQPTSTFTSSEGVRLVFMDGRHLVDKLERWAALAPAASAASSPTLEPLSPADADATYTIGYTVKLHSPASDDSPTDSGNALEYMDGDISIVVPEFPKRDEHPVDEVEEMLLPHSSSVTFPLHRPMTLPRARPVTWTAGSSLTNSGSADAGDVSRSAPNLQSYSSSSISQLRTAPLARDRGVGSDIGNHRGRCGTPIIVSTNFGDMIIGAEDDDEDEYDAEETLPVRDDGSLSPYRREPSPSTSNASSGASSSRGGNGNAAAGLGVNLSGFLGKSPTDRSLSSTPDRGARARRRSPSHHLSSSTPNLSPSKPHPIQTRLMGRRLPKDMDSFFRELEDMIADSTPASPPPELDSSAAHFDTSASAPSLHVAVETAIQRRISRRGSAVERSTRPLSARLSPAPANSIAFDPDEGLHASHASLTSENAPTIQEPSTPNGGGGSIPRAWSLPNGELNRRISAGSAAMVTTILAHLPRRRSRQSTQNPEDQQTPVVASPGVAEYLQPCPWDDDERAAVCPWEFAGRDDGVSGGSGPESPAGISRSMPTLAPASGKKSGGAATADRNGPKVVVNAGEEKVATAPGSRETSRSPVPSGATSPLMGIRRNESMKDKKGGYSTAAGAMVGEVKQALAGLLTVKRTGSGEAEIGMMHASAETRKTGSVVTEAGTSAAQKRMSKGSLSTKLCVPGQADDSVVSLDSAYGSGSMGLFASHANAH